MKRILLALGLALSLSACSAAGDTKSAENSVVVFHRALDNSQFDAIYGSSGEDLKSVSSKEDFTSLLSAVRRKLGRYQSGKTVNWNVNYNTGGHYVTLRRSAQYERGRAEEQFVFKVSGDKAVLVGYHISSNTLITS